VHCHQARWAFQFLSLDSLHLGHVTLLAGIGCLFQFLSLDSIRGNSLVDTFQFAHSFNSYHWIPVCRLLKSRDREDVLSILIIGFLRAAALPPGVTAGSRLSILIIGFVLRHKEDRHKCPSYFQFLSLDSSRGWSRRWARTDPEFFQFLSLDSIRGNSLVDTFQFAHSFNSYHWILLGLGK